MHPGATNLFHPLLFEPHYWQARLARLDGDTRQMQVFGRPDLSRGGLEVSEMVLRSHDGLHLCGVVAHFPIAGPPNRVQVRWSNSSSADLLNLGVVGSEAATLFIFKDLGRRLEDRVLDFLCLLCATKALPAFQGHLPQIELAPKQPKPDEYRIGRTLLRRGWCQSIEIVDIQ